MRAWQRAKGWLQGRFLTDPYKVWGVLFGLFIVQGFCWATPGEIGRGLWAIVVAPGVLVTDYIAVGGLGAALVNVGLAGLLAVGVLKMSGQRPTGLTMGALGLVAGFAFFGKNPLNMAPILLGGLLYSKFMKKPYRDVVLPVVLGTCLAPAVGQMAGVGHWTLGLVLGVAVGLLIGFVIKPVAEAMAKVHEGNNLYNVGFSAGILGMGLFALMRLVGISFEAAQIWSSGHNTELTIFLAVVAVYFTLCGLLSMGRNLSLGELVDIDAPDNDYYRRYEEKAYQAMGLMGFAMLGFMAMVGGEYSGPVLGAIMPVVGFGAFGKSLRHALPAMAGAMLAAVVSMAMTGKAFNSPAFLVGAIFSTCLAPLSKNYGAGWGVVAGFLHQALVPYVGLVHGGLNLYNNGFAAGMAVMLLLPIIKFLQRKG
ncbi:DUF1576 domain-containing protein [Candidatus Saccharibacteria bacterium]|nr:DUF1576 domain-containing protein [Candidatus Saccharibacteria bacterium]